MEASRRDKTAGDLEWSLLLERIAAHAAGAPAAARVRALEPATSMAGAHARTARVAELLELRARGRPLPVRVVVDPDDLIGRLRRGSLASGKELREIATMLALAAELRGFARSERDRHAALATAIDSAPALDELRARLEHAVEADGRVADRAAPALAEARRRVADARRELKHRLGQLIARYAEVLQGAYHAERDGRYVLPVRSDAHLRVPGIVLGSSASGGTLYVEPQEINAIGNRLSIAEAEVEREEARVLGALGDLVRASAADVAVAADACITADLLTAIASWAESASAIPLQVEADHGIDLRGMRHPLLVGAGQEVVPNDLLLAGGQALVLSGPNAGGKTVALKCLGMAAWMARAGLPVPAEPGSRIGWFEPVLTDIGDEQSLVRSLSTFSAHVENLAAIVAASGGHALALLDEVAAGTDPEEGSALAAAVLEALVERGAAVAVTTHYERLKELSAGSARFVNASVGFDMTAMLPTFRLAIGVPGASSALAVAARFGIPPALIERARALLPVQAVQREELVRRLETERRALEQARRDAQAATERQRELASELEEERERARTEERVRLAREAHALASEVREARAALREATARARRAGDSTKELKLIERDVDAAARHIAVGSALASVTIGSAPDRQSLEASDLVVGARVYVPRLATSAEILALPVRGQVRVQAGAMKLAVAVDELERDTAAPKRAAPPPRRAKQAEKRAIALLGRHVPARTQDNTLDLRGQRVDDAMEEVDRFIDRLLRQGEPAGFVLHGHGTGALKSAVREHLGASTELEHWEPAGRDDGGDAFSIFWLRD